MAKRRKRFSKKAGLPPGTLVHLGEPSTEKIKITLVEYDEAAFSDREIVNLDDPESVKGKRAVTWLDVDGVHRTKVIERLGAIYGIHPLVLEDIVSGEQRPKVENFGNYLYIVIRAFYYNEVTEELDSEQISLILDDRMVITFQERQGEILDPVWERLKFGQGRIRKQGADYLAYSLLDVIIDHYFVVLEKLGERIEVLEDALTENPDTKHLKTLHRFKREMIALRRSIWPLRDVVSELERSDCALIKPETRMYLRDLHDHTVRVVDMIETFRDMLSTMLDLYLSSVSNRTTQIMNVLTIIATIFVPATFITSFYGMNFKYMPELDSKWGYPAVIAVMIAVSASLFVFFRRKRWV